MINKNLPNGGPFLSKRDAWCYAIGLVNGFLLGLLVACFIGWFVLLNTY